MATMLLRPERLLQEKNFTVRFVELIFLPHQPKSSLSIASELVEPVLERALYKLSIVQRLCPMKRLPSIRGLSLHGIHSCGPL